MSFKSKAAEDKRVKSFYKQLENSVYSLPVAELLQELQSMHTGRLVRSLKTEQVVQKQQSLLIKSILQNQAYRSRCVEIKIDCFRNLALLNERVETLQKYLQIKYAISLRNEYSTVGDRRQAIDTVLAPAITQQHELSSIIDIADLIVEDIDKTAWAMKNITDVLGLNMARERNI